MKPFKNLGRFAWLCVDTKFASYALAYDCNGRIVGGAPYGMKVIGSERDLHKVATRLANMGATLWIIPAPGYVV